MVRKPGGRSEGPDGDREIDVSVRGQIDGEETFILIECKDWKRAVGIEELDSLDSKREDVGADKTMIFSNGGFTSRALNKARRKDISCVSALVAGEKRIRFVLNRQHLAKRLTVVNWRGQITGTLIPPPGYVLEELEYKGMSIAPWLRDLSLRLLSKNQSADVIQHGALFKEPTAFTYRGAEVKLTLLEVRLQCKQSWVVQTVREDVSHGLYDHLKNAVLVPDNQLWTLEYDRSNWQEVALDDVPEVEGDPAPGILSVSLGMTLLNPICADAIGPTPPLDEAILKTETLTELTQPIANA